MNGGWNLEQLGVLCDILDSQRKPITKRDRTAGEYPYYGATGIVDYVNNFIFDEPLVLVGEDGAKWESGDDTAFMVDGRCWVNNHAHVLRPHRNTILDDWLVYYLNHSDLSEFVSGLTVPKLNQGRLREIPIPVPPLPEQRRIVGQLDEDFAEIATVQANAETNQHNARAIFESHLQSVFTQGGVGWVEKPLAELCDSSRVITYGVIKLGKDIADGVPCLRTSNVRWLRIETEGIKKITPALSLDYSRTILRGGEVLVNVRGTLGGVAVAGPEMAGWNVSREVAVVPVDSSRVNPAFVSYLIGSGRSQQWLGGVKKGATYIGINIEDLRLLPVNAPHIEEQSKVVEHLDALYDETQRLASLYESKVAALQVLKMSLLHQAFTGAL
jgi:type I restriction enzyme S subunit